MIKKIIIFIVIVMVALSIYFGSYLPLKKSQLWISVYRHTPQMQSFEDFKEVFNQPLDFYSPIGRSEELKFFTNEVLTLLKRNPSEPVARQLINYIEEKYQIFFANPDDRNFTKSFVSLGNIYRLLWSMYGQAEDFEKAEYYYQEGLKLSPGRPQFLYSLFDLYISGGDIVRAKEIGDEILEHWPQDSAFKSIYQELIK